jgi:hypothetical protein
VGRVLKVAVRFSSRTEKPSLSDYPTERPPWAAFLAAIRGARLLAPALADPTLDDAAKVVTSRLGKGTGRPRQRWNQGCWKPSGHAVHCVAAQMAASTTNRTMTIWPQGILVADIAALRMVRAPASRADL